MGREEKMREKCKAFKKDLACVFDDNLHTKKWHNVVDWVIIALILISSLEIFLSTFEGVSEQYGGVLRFVDVFTTVVFTIEVTLRIWVADVVNPKYAGFWGRVRYCFSFYGLIDCLSTYPFYLSFCMKIPVAALKILRIARLFRIFRYMKSFRILGKVIIAKKQELSISLMFLCILTVILSFLLYYAEHDAQPELCENGWQTLVWAFAKYLGDPGKIADFPLATVGGQVIASIVGLLGIAIFAVPAGLIGSGFVEVLEDERHSGALDQNKLKLHNAFERVLDRYTGYQIMPQFLSLVDVQARMKMKENDVFEAVESSSDFRFINVAATVPVDRLPQDKLAVEAFYVNTKYGCVIDRGSLVTIVAPSNVADPIIGHFAYYLAKIGGFNYVGREIGRSHPYFSFYSNSSNRMHPDYPIFLSDIERLSGREGSWVIAMLAASGANEPEYPTQVHFGYGGPKGDESFDAPDLLVRDKEELRRLLSEIEANLKNEFGVSCDRQRYHQSNSSGLFIRKLKNRDNVNGLVLRIAWSLICHDPRRMAVCKTIADTIKAHIEPEKENESLPELKIKGLGVSDYKF